MAKIRMTQVRALFGAVVAIIVLVAFVAIAAAVLGYHLPVLGALTDLIGM